MPAESDLDVDPAIQRPRERAISLLRHCSAADRLARGGEAT